LTLALTQVAQARRLDGWLGAIPLISPAGASRLETVGSWLSY